MERRKISFAVGVLSLAIAATPLTAHALAPPGIFYRLVCDGLFKFFAKSVESVDSVTRKVIAGRREILKLRDGNVDYYGTFVAGQFENYLTSFEQGLLEIGALAKRSIKEDQAAIARRKIVEFRAASATPAEFDGAMDFIIRDLKGKSLPFEKYENLKVTYRETFDRIAKINLEETRVQSNLYWAVDDAAFQAHLIRMMNQTEEKGGLLATVVNFVDYGPTPAYMARRGVGNSVSAGRMRSLLIDFNVQYASDVLTNVTAKSVESMRLSQWTRPIEVALDAKRTTEFVQGIDAILFEGLKEIELGKATHFEHELDPAVLGRLLEAMRTDFAPAAAKLLGTEETGALVKRLELYANLLSNHVPYQKYASTGFREQIRALAKTLAK